MFLRKCLVYQNGDAQRAAGIAERFIAFRQAERLKISVDFFSWEVDGKKMNRWWEVTCLWIYFSRMIKDNKG